MDITYIQFSLIVKLSTVSVIATENLFAIAQKLCHISITYKG